jgi:hypothetical protein
LRSVAAAATLLTAATAFADPPAPRVVPDHVVLGQPFVEEIEVAHAAGARVALKPPASLGDFSLLGVAQEERGGTTLIRARLALYRLGAHQTPSLAVDVGGATVTAAPVTVTATPTLAAGGKPSLADIHAPVALMRWSRWLFGFGGAALVALAVAIVLAVQSWRRRRTLEARTRRALDGLAHDLDAGAPLYPWWSTYATLLRAYVGARGGFNALERTTAELAVFLARHPLPGLDSAALTGWLSQADLVKFARDVSDVDGARRALSFARVVLEATTAAARSKQKGEPSARLAVS